MKVLTFLATASSLATAVMAAPPHNGLGQVEDKDAPVAAATAAAIMAVAGTEVTTAATTAAPGSRHEPKPPVLGFELPEGRCDLAKKLEHPNYPGPTDLERWEKETKTSKTFGPLTAFAMGKNGVLRWFKKDNDPNQIGRVKLDPDAVADYIPPLGGLPNDIAKHRLGFTKSVDHVWESQLLKQFLIQRFAKPANQYTCDEVSLLQTSRMGQYGIEGGYWLQNIYHQLPGQWYVTPEPADRAALEKQGQEDSKVVDDAWKGLIESYISADTERNDGVERLTWAEAAEQLNALGKFKARVKAPKLRFIGPREVNLDFIGLDTDINQAKGAIFDNMKKLELAGRAPGQSVRTTLPVPPYVEYDSGSGTVKSSAPSDEAEADGEPEATSDPKGGENDTKNEQSLLPGASDSKETKSGKKLFDEDKSQSADSGDADENDVNDNDDNFGKEKKLKPKGPKTPEELKAANEAAAKSLEQRIEPLEDNMAQLDTIAYAVNLLNREDVEKVFKKTNTRMYRLFMGLDAVLDKAYADELEKIKGLHKLADARRIQSGKGWATYKTKMRDRIQGEKQGPKMSVSARDGESRGPEAPKADLSSSAPTKDSTETSEETDDTATTGQRDPARVKKWKKFRDYITRLEQDGQVFWLGIVNDYWRRPGYPEFLTNPDVNPLQVLIGKLQRRRDDSMVRLGDLFNKAQVVLGNDEDRINSFMNQAVDSVIYDVMQLDLGAVELRNTQYEKRIKFAPDFTVFMNAKLKEINKSLRSYCRTSWNVITKDLKALVTEARSRSLYGSLYWKTPQPGPEKDPLVTAVLKLKGVQKRVSTWRKVYGEWLKRDDPDVSEDGEPKTIEPTKADEMTILKEKGDEEELSEATTSDRVYPYQRLQLNLLRKVKVGSPEGDQKWLWVDVLAPGKNISAKGVTPLPVDIPPQEINQFDYEVARVSNGFEPTQKKNLKSGGFYVDESGQIIRPKLPEGMDTDLKHYDDLYREVDLQKLLAREFTDTTELKKHFNDIDAAGTKLGPIKNAIDVAKKEYDQIKVALKDTGGWRTDDEYNTGFLNERSKAFGRVLGSLGNAGRKLKHKIEGLVKTGAAALQAETKKIKTERLLEKQRALEEKQRALENGQEVAKISTDVGGENAVDTDKIKVMNEG